MLELRKKVSCSGASWLYSGGGAVVTEWLGQDVTTSAKDGKWGTLRKRKTMKKGVTNSKAKASRINGLQGCGEHAGRCPCPWSVVVRAVTDAVQLFEEPQWGEEEGGPLVAGAAVHAVLKVDALNVRPLNDHKDDVNLPKQAVPRVFQRPHDLLGEQVEDDLGAVLVDSVGCGNACDLTR